MNELADPRNLVDSREVVATPEHQSSELDISASTLSSLSATAAPLHLHNNNNSHSSAGTSVLHSGQQQHQQKQGGNNSINAVFSAGGGAGVAGVNNSRKRPLRESPGVGGGVLDQPHQHHPLAAAAISAHEDHLDQNSPKRHNMEGECRAYGVRNSNAVSCI